MHLSFVVIFGSMHMLFFATDSGWASAAKLRQEKNGVEVDDATSVSGWQFSRGLKSGQSEERVSETEKIAFGKMLGAFSERQQQISDEMLEAAHIARGKLFLELINKEMVDKMKIDNAYKTTKFEDWAARNVDPQDVFHAIKVGEPWFKNDVLKSIAEPYLDFTPTKAAAITPKE
ncbi:RxLR-like protein [Plasmopara halstedii]|uniref:RxLR-like protein n=1 Tax=Plasmopara halstedii TaxID=4781 RepID=A0A0P1AJR4_PLAHL|nr:RxLR-like protein [Plasmopara halstedii]CEG41317.1 RxLR-like protein [Plasmopara halstedii]|eukprot:XP_024577686.1 RxLR-like protein [Plasmopara halstedii]